MDVLEIASRILQTSFPLTRVMHPQKMCFGIIAVYCAMISPAITVDSFDWIISHFKIISHLCNIFTAYCKARALSDNEMNITNTLLQDLLCYKDKDVHTFFDLIKNIQLTLFGWQRKIQYERQCNYDDIMLYASHSSDLLKISRLVSVPSSMISDIMSTKNQYLQLFEQVNAYLIKYIPDNPNTKYCTLPNVLLQYGIEFPTKLKMHLQFPGRTDSNAEQLLQCNPSPSTNGIFNPPDQKVSLLGEKTLTLKELSFLAEQLEHFVQPIHDHMQMLVFFTLNQSEIFNNYVHLQLKRGHDVKIAARSVQSPLIPGFTQPKIIFGQEKDHEPEVEGVSMLDLASALNSTKEFLSKLIRGTAKYSEIISEDGQLVLDNINIEAEFKILMAFFRTVKHLVPNVMNNEGLECIKCMLELFQYTSVHIPAIHHVCEQYNLEGCLSDPRLKELVIIADETERTKANQLPCETVAKVQYVKSLLCLNGKGSQSLSLFPAVANSTTLYQFIKEAKFSGQDEFNLQCQLITDLLQHEEYSDTVLTHLLATYQLIQPFLDTKQNFTSLMTTVITLDVSELQLNQLETVNSNISLISHWFSRAEVSITFMLRLFK